MKIQNYLVSNILDWPPRNFAHVTTVALSWRVQNIVVIGRIHFTLECFEFSSNFEFDRKMLSGTGVTFAPMAHTIHQHGKAPCLPSQYNEKGTSILPDSVQHPIALCILKFGVHITSYDFVQFECCNAWLQISGCMLPWAATHSCYNLF